MKPAEMDAWMQGFYRAPQPERLEEFLRVARETPLWRGQKVPGLVASLFKTDTVVLSAWQHADTMLIAFCARVFEATPGLAATVLQTFDNQDEGRLRTLWIAAWWAGQAESAGVLEQATRTSKRAAAFVQTALLANRPVPLLEVPLEGPVVLDMLWTGFFASGNAAHVERIIEALALLVEEDVRRSAVGQSAMWSLRANAPNHPVVLDTCRRVARRLDGLEDLTVGGVIRNALDRAFPVT